MTAASGHPAEGEVPRLRSLFELPNLPAYLLPRELRRRYDGELGFEPPALYANFVSSLDGVVALEEGPPSLISGRSEADRFVMGLLRACASAVMVGASTVRAEPKHVWTPERVFPAASGAFAELRRVLRLDPRPAFVVLTRSGRVDPSHRAFEEGAIVLTTAAGAEALRGKLPSASSAVALAGDGALSVTDALGWLRAQGHDVVLTEGGPTLAGGLLEANLLDELFLTLSPRVAGRAPGRRRLGLAEGFGFEPRALAAATLLSAKRHRSHLFLRYGLGHEA